MRNSRRMWSLLLAFNSYYKVHSFLYTNSNKLVGLHCSNKPEIRRLLAQDSESNKEPPPIVSYQSRSTVNPDPTCDFHHGSQDRQNQLDQALFDLGINATSDLLSDPQLKGSTALRTYSSFVLPKSKGAFAMTQQPQRASVVANQISFLLREHRSHQESWLRNHDKSLQEAQELFQQQERHPISILLDDVRSAHNVGNILRLAEAARVNKVYLCGSMTPSPPHPKVLKTALGAAEYVPMETTKRSTLDTVRQLRQEGITVYAVETTSRSIPLWKVDLFGNYHKDDSMDDSSMDRSSKGVAFVFGNELVGVDIQVLEECDGSIIVPMHGIKNSLNVATCASVITWEALRQWDQFREGKDGS